MASAHQDPRTPQARPDVNDVREECDRHARYTDYVQSCWRAHQYAANEEAGRVTRRVIEQRRSA